MCSLVFLASCAEQEELAAPGGGGRAPTAGSAAGGQAGSGGVGGTGGRPGSSGSTSTGGAGRGGGGAGGSAGSGGGGAEAVAGSGGAPSGGNTTGGAGSGQAGSVPVGDPLYKLEYAPNNTTTSNDTIGAFLRLTNVQGPAVALDSVTLRYYLTDEGFPPMVSFGYADNGGVAIAANVTGKVSPLVPATTTANSYIEIGFQTAAGLLQPGKALTVHLYAYSGGSLYDELNDYSHDVSKTSLAVWNNVTVSVAEELVWGAAPE